MPLLDVLFGLLQWGDGWGNTLQRWLAALAVALGVGLALWLGLRLLVRRAEFFARRHPTDWFQAVVDLLGRTRGWFILVMAAYSGSLLLVLPKAGNILASAAIIALLVQAALWADGLVRFHLLRQAERRVETDAAAATTLVALGFLAQIGIWSLAIVLVLANLGVDVTAMVAGLGIGGVAVALAAQNVLGDLLASASIVLDKPFVLGDFIVVGEEKGTVEHVGLKTTRVRSVSGEQLVFSNNDLLKSRIRNFKRMSQRRVQLNLAVTYRTPAERLAAIPQLLREVIEAQGGVRFERAHFQKFGDTALLFEAVYFVLSADYNVYMDVQQTVNLAVVRQFAAHDIRFAYPAHTAYLET